MASALLAYPAPEAPAAEPTDDAASPPSPPAAPDSGPQMPESAPDEAKQAAEGDAASLPLLVVDRGDAKAAAPVPRGCRRRASSVSRAARLLSALLTGLVVLAGAALFIPSPLADRLGNALGALPRRAVERAPVPAPPAATPRKVFGLGRLLPVTDVVRVAAPSGVQTPKVAVLHVREGDRVEAGDLLATLDNEAALAAALAKAEADVAVRRAALERARQDVRNALARAEAALRRAESEVETAEADLRRQEALFGKGIVAAAALEKARLARDQAREAEAQARADLARYPAAEAQAPEVVEAAAQVEVAEREAARARAELGEARVLAPVSGTILDVHAQAGETIGTDGLLDMGDTSAMVVEAEIYETEIGGIEPGDPATVTAAALGAPLEGRVGRVGLRVGRQSIIDRDPAANTDARVVEVVIALDAASLERAARFTNLEVRVAIEPDALPAPAPSLPAEPSRPPPIAVDAPAPEAPSVAPASEPRAGGKEGAEPASAPRPPETMRVTASRLNMREAPGTDAAVVAAFDRGTRLAVLARQGEWVRAKAPDGRTGWLSARHLEPAPDAAGRLP